MLPALAAFAASGLTWEDLHRRGRVSPRYFRHLARHGAPYGTALRLARVLGCSPEVFFPQQDRAGARAARQRRGAGRTRHAAGSLGVA